VSVGSSGDIATGRTAGPHKRWKVGRAPKPAAGTTYQTLRHQFRTGDLLLFRGSKLLSGAIEHLSDSPYSHVAMLARWQDRIVAFQADLRGVEVLPASTMVCKYEGKVDWWALTREAREATGFDDKALLDSALTLLGIKYGYWQLVLLGLRILLGRTLSPKDAHATPDTLFCSQFVSLATAAPPTTAGRQPQANDASTSRPTSPPPGSSSRAPSSSTAAAGTPAGTCSSRARQRQTRAA
jgi:hypothetical protein